MALRWMRDVDSANPGRTPSLRGRAAIRFLQRLRPIPVVPEGAAAPGFRSDVTEVGIRNPGGRGEAENRRALEPMPLRATQQGRDSGTCPLSPACWRHRTFPLDSGPPIALLGVSARFPPLFSGERGQIHGISARGKEEFWRPFRDVKIEYKFD